MDVHDAMFHLNAGGHVRRAIMPDGTFVRRVNPPPEPEPTLKQRLGLDDPFAGIKNARPQLPAPRYEAVHPGVDGDNEFAFTLRDLEAFDWELIG